MQVIGATNSFPTGQWTVALRNIDHWRGTSIAVNAQTVANVGYISAGKTEYNYAAGGVGMFAGAALFGPVGLVVGGLLPKAFKGSVVEFAIQLTDGTVLRAKGKPSEYESLVKWSMEAPGSGALNRLNAAAERLNDRMQQKDGSADIDDDVLTDEDHEWIQTELATQEAVKRAKKSPEAKAERKARIKEVQKSGLPFSEKYRRIRAIEDDYR